MAQQARAGDRHVYGARSRFLNGPVLAMLDQAGWPNEPQATAMLEAASAVRVDIGANLRAL